MDKRGESRHSGAGMVRLRLPALVIVAVPLLASCGKPGVVCPDCNVILITIDTLRPDHLGVYGYAKATSPRIDAFAEHATVFEHAISPAPCTTPAVLQVLTGTLNHGTARPRLAEYLRDAGYETSAFVSHQFFRSPEGPLPKYARGFQHFDIQRDDERDRWAMTSRRASQVTDAALAYLGKSGTRGKKLVWLHYFDPHDPYAPPPGYDRFAGEHPVPCDGDRRLPLLAARGPGQRWEDAGAIFTPAQVERYRSMYDAEISYTDEQVGRLLDGLGELGLLERSVVIITADHGERLGEYDKWDHCGSMHGFELDVPLLISVAGEPLAGQRRNLGAVTTLDILPTVLDLVGVRATASRLDGINLLETGDGRRVFTLWTEGWLIQDQRWKLYLLKSRDVQLFDLAADAQEQVDVARQNPAVRDDLLRALEVESRGRKQVAGEVDRVVEQLRAIGYIQ